VNGSSTSVAPTSASWFPDADAALLLRSLAHRLSLDSLPEHVCLWSVWLDQLSPANVALFQWLSPDERKRAARFAFERDRVRFIAGRGFLRWLLATSLDIDPAGVEFAYGSTGKPSLAGRSAGAVHFNLSHSEGLTVCAISREAEVGVDIERIRDVPEARQILAAHFPGSCSVAWRELPGDQQSEGFLRLWVRHEAEVKRSGRGLAQPEAEAPRFATAESVFEFAPAAGFVGALAVRGV
jgi:4'-phosphopantetheinyl transferase